jgi:hypothetical protein
MVENEVFEGFGGQSIIDSNLKQYNTQ